MKSKVLSGAEAAELVRSGDTITTSGFVGIGIEAYNLPQGVHLATSTATSPPASPARSPRSGLGTFVDPRLDGGKINARTTEDLVELMEIDGEEWLFYKAFPIQVAILRGTTADPDGNITMEREALTLENLSIAMAARNSGGLVIVQVERIAAAARSIRARCRSPACWSTASSWRSGRSTTCRPSSPRTAPPSRARSGSPWATSRTSRWACARSSPAASPSSCRSTAWSTSASACPRAWPRSPPRRSILRYLTLTAEPGVIGGMPAGGLDFGAAINAEAMIDQNQQFDFYDGGGLDMAVLGLAQADAEGNVNVSRFGPKLAGAGGFINISQNARAWCSPAPSPPAASRSRSRTASCASSARASARKFVERRRAGHLQRQARRGAGKPVLYVTERCVFQLTPAGLEVIEIAPGIDLERDILAHMDFTPIIADVRAMDARIFRDEPMDLKRDLLHLDLADRIQRDEAANRLYINFEKLRVRSRDDVERLRAQVEKVCAGQKKRVDVIVNYDGTRIDEEIQPAYEAMVEDLEDRFYGTVTRYSSSAFTRMKLGEALRKRRPHIFETAEDAKAFLAARQR